jgi:hypothetical protein
MIASHRSNFLLPSPVGARRSTRGGSAKEDRFVPWLVLVSLFEFFVLDLNLL